MSVKTSTVGAVRFSGEDADAFRRMVTHGRPKKAAVESLKAGEKLPREFEKPVPFRRLSHSTAATSGTFDRLTEIVRHDVRANF